MKELPIIFTSESVRAILEGRKTQTRRVIKPQPIDTELIEIICGGKVHYRRPVNDPMIEEALKTPEYHVRSVIAGLIEKCPYGQPGDRLWVRETWDVRFLEGYLEKHICYRANHVAIPLKHEYNKKLDYNWKSPMFMPRWASRITLEIVNIRVERVQDISWDDVIAEGAVSSPECSEWTWFSGLWKSINDKRGYPWDSNPWVWVIEFKRLGEGVEK
jgi:hypothetical protein